MFASLVQDEDADNDSIRFPPISKRSAKFNQDDYKRSLDPLDELASDINHENENSELQNWNAANHRPLFLTDGVSGQRYLK